MTKGSYYYRKIYEENYGKIPIDEHGRTYEIHHIDGNRHNNDKTNLRAVTIQEHYNIHYDQGDYGACVMIAKRMNLPPDHLASIQKGVKRPGIGGVKKGTPNKFKGIKRGKINLTKEGLERQKLSRKKWNKISDESAIELRKLFEEEVPVSNMEKIGKIMRNGKKFSYLSAFSEHYSKIFNVTPNYIRGIIKGTCKNVLY